jgi:hypothetical protein
VREAVAAVARELEERGSHAGGMAREVLEAQASEGARGIRRRRQRLRHPGDRPLGHPQSDPDSTQL